MSDEHRSACSSNQALVETQGRLEVEGSVDRVRRHGRHLVFARVSDFSQQIVFDSNSFHPSCNATEQHGCPETHPTGDLASRETAPNEDDPCGVGAWQPFPASKSSLKVGDRVWISARDIDGRITVWQWRRLSSCPPAAGPSAAGRVSKHPARASEAPPPTNEGSSKGRRAGVAVAKGWVGCPLCPSTSLKRYNRGAGLESHLTAVHSDSLQREGSGRWEEVHKLADAMGIFGSRVRHGAKRNAPTPGAKGEDGTDSAYGRQLKHPGLVAARDGDAEALQALLQEGWDPLGADSLDCHGASALDWAAGGGHLRCLQLLAPAAKGRQACRRDGRGPAHWAARNGHTETLSWLLEHTSSLSAESPTGDGTTMVMLAAFGGHAEAVQLLVERFGAEVGRTNSWGCDAGHFAAMGGSVEMCRWLREHGLSFGRKQVEGHSALHKAAMRGQEGVLRWMLESDGALPESEAAGLRMSTCKDISPAFDDASAGVADGDFPSGEDESVRRRVPLPIGNFSGRQTRRVYICSSSRAHPTAASSCDATTPSCASQSIAPVWCLVHPVMSGLDSVGSHPTWHHSNAEIECELK